MYLKETVDRLRFPPYCHAIGICLVAASFGAENALVAHLLGPKCCGPSSERRLDGALRFCTVDGHTQSEVRDILGQYETYYRMHQFPKLRLSRWSGEIYKYLTDPSFDPAQTHQVTMGNVNDLVNLTLEAAFEQKLDDITPVLLRDSAAWLKTATQKNVVISGDPARRRRIGSSNGQDSSELQASSTPQGDSSAKVAENTSKDEQK